MNQRSTNGSGHATMLSRELIQRLDRLGIAKDAGDLPALLAVDGLAFGAGLGLHGSGQRGAQGDEAALFLAELRGLGRTPRGAEAVGAGRPQVDPAKAAILRQGQGLHGVLRVGPIPTVGTRYAVTSDVSTTVRREAAA